MEVQCLLFCQLMFGEEDVIDCDWIVEYKPHIARTFRLRSPTWGLLYYSACWLGVSLLACRSALRYFM